MLGGRVYSWQLAEWLKKSGCCTIERKFKLLVSSPLIIVQVQNLACKNKMWKIIKTARRNWYCHLEDQLQILLQNIWLTSYLSVSEKDVTALKGSQTEKKCYQKGYSLEGNWNIVSFRKRMSKRRHPRKICYKVNLEGNKKYKGGNCSIAFLLSRKATKKLKQLNLIKLENKKTHCKLI